VASPLSSDEALCAGWVLLAGGLAFFSGQAGRLTSQYKGSINPVIAARVLANESPRPELPAVPRGVLAGNVFSILACFWMHCRELIDHHVLFMAALVACAISSGVWLMMAASIQNAADRERHARIEEFIANAEAPVPPPIRGLESMPGWFELWSWMNAVVFFCLMGRLVLLLLPNAAVGAG
jgi:hypothetical protein